MRALFVRILALAATLVSVVGVSPAHAQHDWVLGRSLELPPAPEGYLEATVGNVRWTYPAGEESLRDELQERIEEAWPELEHDLGQDVDDTLVVRLARNPEQMRSLAPRGAPPPGYASGVAYPGLGVILLTKTAPETWTPPELEQVLVHELSHVALRRAVADGSEELPRWFVEGVAIHHARERSLDRFRTLWNAHLQETLLPLDALDRSFPARVHEVSVAYAQAADVVAFLRREDPDGVRFRELVRHLRDGQSFDDALLDAYALTPTQLEREWSQAIAERMGTLPMVIGGATFPVVGVGLLLLAWRKRRKQAAKKLGVMAEEERVHDAAIERLEAIAEARRRERAEEEEQIRILVSGDPPQGREADVPTVEHEGREHTLH
ncbi:MAG: hypothetical protein H6723_14015 [Sandaracinus sp.]|nr:hypothetical protein [Sandaracinus sp.]